MLPVHEFQTRMRDHSLDLGDGVALLPSLAELHAPPAARRLDIHRNNTMIGLGAALADSYPVVARLVGEECFTALARAFVRAHPPAQAPLFRFGHDFPAFLAVHPLAADLPYLADVARLEAAWLHAYHAAEAEPLDPARLGELPPERLGEVSFALHPSHRFLASAWPVAAIWRANREEDVPALSLDRGGQHLLVVRPRAEVEVVELSPGAFSLVMALGLDQCLEAAWDSALSLEPEFDLEPCLARLLGAGIFVEAHLP
jgi:hypothetical protein